MVTISVVMPMYNTAVPFLKEAVESILNQTFGDFEFIIIDDGSTNDSPAYLDALTDPRIRIIRNKENIGITKSLNLGFRAAQGKYIARMDSDDISFPERFEKQVAFMDSHPDVIACGTRIANLGTQPSPPKAAVNNMNVYRVRMLFCNPGPKHSTAFFRLEKMNQYHIEYDERLVYAQDYGLWMTISQLGQICILPEVLHYNRVHSGQISIEHREKQIQCDKMTQRKLLTQLVGNVTEEELDEYYVCSTGYYAEATITPQIASLYDRMISANKQKRIYDQAILKQKIIEIKKRLIDRTFTKDMSKIEKILLIYRFLPFIPATQMTKDMITMKIQSIKRCGRFK